MDWPREKILDTVESLRKDAREMNERSVHEKYGVFKEKFPKLFYSSLDPNFNIPTLEKLLDYRDKSEKDNVPTLVRDTAVSEEFAKKYLYPVVGEPSLEDKKKAARKIVEKMKQG